MNIFLLAHTAQSSCTLNGQPIDCGELAQKAKPFIGLGVGLLAFIAIILIATFIFWLVMLIHAIQHHSPDRTLWIVILLVSFITGFSLVGALVYYFAEKKKAEALSAPGGQPTTSSPPATQSDNQPPRQTSV
jgi:NADH:ubiquinone oxidoreductase subunit 5 (subunit L)/multisubunit Na+/H+ antiporter MnhA subunit